MTRLELGEGPGDHAVVVAGVEVLRVNRSARGELALLRYLSPDMGRLGHAAGPLLAWVVHEGAEVTERVGLPIDVVVGAARLTISADSARLVVAGESA